MTVTLNRHSVTLAVDAGKAAVWLRTLDQHISRGTIGTMAAQRLAGRLAFGRAAVWDRLLGARLRSLFAVAYGQKVDLQHLLADLAWWARFISLSGANELSLQPKSLPWVVLHTDSTGKGAMGGVLVSDSSLWFQAKASNISDLLQERKTQVNAYELFTRTPALSGCR